MVIVWFYFTPYLAINNLKDAVAKKDYETVSSYIDFTSLKESIKTQLNASLTKNAAAKGEDSFISIMAKAFIAPMVDAMVTPENMTRIIGGKDPIIDKADEQKILASDVDEKVDMSMGYKDFNTFSVDVKSSKKTITFIFHRDGLFSWKLAALKLPEEEPSKAATAPMPAQEAEVVEAVPAEFSSISELPFIGKKTYSFFGGNAVEESIKIDSDGHTKIETCGRENCTTSYEGPFSNPIFFGDGGILIKNGKIHLLKHNGSPEMDCMGDGAPCISDLY